MEGEFCASNKTRYFISIPQDTGRQLTHFELACMQLQKKLPIKKVSSDPHRHLLINKPKLTSNIKSFYLPTMCVIGAMAGLFSKYEAIDVEKIVNAVAEHNEFWRKGIDSFNNLFEADSSSYLRASSINTHGRLVAGCCFTGLQIVCDLIKEARNMALAGKHNDAAEITVLLHRMGLVNLHTYQLLLSPKHPEFQNISDAVDDYENKYELCIDNDNKWILVSKREIKKISFIGDEANYKASSSNDSYIVVTNNEAETITNEVAQFEDNTELQATTEYVAEETAEAEYVVEENKEEQKEAQYEANESDWEANEATQVDELVDQHQEEKDYHQEEHPQSETKEEHPQSETKAEPVIRQSDYSAKRTKRLPPGVTNGEDKLGSDKSQATLHSSEPKKAGFAPKTPSNANFLEFDADI